MLAYDAHEVCWINIPYFSLSSATILKHRYGFYWKFGDFVNGYVPTALIIGSYNVVTPTVQN